MALVIPDPTPEVRSPRRRAPRKCAAGAGRCSSARQSRSATAEKADPLRTLQRHDGREGTPHSRHPRPIANRRAFADRRGARPGRTRETAWQTPRHRPKRTFDDRPGCPIIHLEAGPPMQPPRERSQSALQARRSAGRAGDRVPSQLAHDNRREHSDDVPPCATIGAVSLPRRLLTLLYEREARKLRIGLRRLRATSG